jgi:hypothetical protein
MYKRDARTAPFGVRGFSPAFIPRRFSGVSKAAMNRRTPYADRASAPSPPPKMIIGPDRQRRCAPFPPAHLTSGHRFLRNPIRSSTHSNSRRSMSLIGAPGAGGMTFGQSMIPRSCSMPFSSSRL